MAKIIKLKNGYYATKIYDKRLQKQKQISAPSKTELKEKVAVYLSDITTPSSNMSIKAAIESFITNRTAVASPSTIKGYRQLQRTYYDGIAHYTISGIQSADIQKEINKWSENLSPKTVRNIYGLLITSIKAADPYKRINVTLPQKAVVEYSLPNENDVSSMIKKADRDLKIAILLASIGTLRRGEVCALEYSDINDCSIHVHADMIQNENKEWIVKPIPKNGSSDRYIDFPQAVIDEIGTGEGRILSCNPNALTHRFTRLREQLGINCRFHDLRHYAASIMHAIGVPDQYIMKRGGWKSDSTLKKVYRNTLSEIEKEFSNKTNDYMSKLLISD